MASKLLLKLLRPFLLRRGYGVVPLSEAQGKPLPTDAVSYEEDCYARALAPQEGPVNLQEGRFLAELSASIEKDGPIIEIGTLMGWSTRVIAMAKAPTRRLITVDSFTWNPLGVTPEAHYRITQRVLDEACQLHGVELVRMDKAKFYSTYTGPAPAMFFCDAMHTYEETLADILWAKSVGCPLICGHDYSENWPGVMQAVEEQGGARELVDSLWVL